MYVFTTLSGSIYGVENGRLSRIGAEPVTNGHDMFADGHEAITEVITAPAPGVNARFRLRGHGPITTSKVLAVYHPESRLDAGAIAAIKADALAAIARVSA